MTIVGAFEAKTHFSQLLSRVAVGEVITVTRNGKPVAQLAPISQDVSRMDAIAAAAELRSHRRNMRLEGLSVKDLVSEGRK